MSYLKDIQAGNWYDAQTAPSALEAGSLRGVDGLNDAVHLLEKKRFLRKELSLVDVSVPASQNYVILGAGELPPTAAYETGAVGLGTVAAAHGGTFGDHSLDEIAGGTAISPKNLVQVVDGATRDPILSADSKVYGLLHAETAGSGTATDATPNRLQVSFVRINAAGDDLEACPVADIENQSVNLCFARRVRFEDLTEQDMMSDAVVDVPAGATVTRQVAYNNQGVTPVELSASAHLDLATGVSWHLRDNLDAELFSITEGSGSGATSAVFSSDVDLLDIQSVDTHIRNDLRVAIDSARPIRIGQSLGRIETEGGSMELLSANELFFDDVNAAGSGWSIGAGIKLSETSAEWDDFEAAFGEVSLLDAIVQAKSGSVKTVVYATVTGGNYAASTDLNGPTTYGNLDTDLPSYASVGFSPDTVEYYMNGERLVTGVDVVAGTASGDIQLNKQVKGTGSRPDVIQAIVWGE
ncbi:MAG: hypothetical protein B7733_06090 [Myxococcales bacterium FL481]|nr:MAG: hypothetical protein B7733_06090 [Myxococcales bacterium FL481]